MNATSAAATGVPKRTTRRNQSSGRSPNRMRSDALPPAARAGDGELAWAVPASSAPCAPPDGARRARPPSARAGVIHSSTATANRGSMYRGW